MTGHRRSPRWRPRIRLRTVALNIGAALGVTCIAVALAAAFGGVTPLVFRSGSMSPEIHTGALALARHTPVTEIVVGDVVSVRNSAGTRVTHRVVSVALSDGRGELILRGDANSTPDSEVYPVTSVDQVFFDLPYLGYPLAWAQHPAVVFLVGASVPALLYVAFAPRRRTAGGGRRKMLGPSASALAVVGLVGLVAPGVPGTSAAFSDTATMTTGSLGAHTVLPPVSSTCMASSPTATISWPEKNSQYDYEVVLKRSGGSVVSTKAVTGNAVSQTYQAPGDFGFGGVLAVGTYDFSVEVRSYVASSPTWRSDGVLVASKKIRVNVLTVAFIPVVSGVSCV